MTARKHRFIKPRKTSVFWGLFTPPLAIAAVLLIGYLWFIINIAGSTTDVATHTDAIVVLTGGPGRIPAGVELLQNHLADHLLISGVNPAVGNSEIEHLHKEAATLSNCCITIGHQATDTIGNAAETAAWLKAKNYSSLRLVTADYHMPRAVIDFRLEMPDVVIIPNPVTAARPDRPRLLFQEYIKYLAALLRFEIITLSRSAT